MWRDNNRKYNRVLYNFTRSIASGITLTWVTVRSLLTNLYLVNREKSELPLLYEGDFPNIYPQAHDEFLDRLGYQFGVTRIPGEDDEGYRIRILFALRRNSTKAGIAESLEVLFGAVGMTVKAVVQESYAHAFDGTSTSFDAPMRSHKGSLLYGVVIYVLPVTEELTSANIPGQGEIDLGGQVFHRIMNNYYRQILDAFQEKSFTSLFNESIAAGVQVDRVVVVEPGAGGSRYIKSW